MSPTRRPRPKRSGEFLAEDLSKRLRQLQTRKDFDTLFRDEVSCRLYLTALRWPQGFVCPHCEERTHAEASKRGLLRCLGCGYVCSPTTGTALDKSALPISVWLRAIWELVSRESGANPARLAAALPVASERMIHAWLDAIKDVFDKVWRAPLHGLVEVAKVPVEVVVRDARGRANARHTMVGIAVEVQRNDELGGVRVCSLPRVDATTMLNFVRRAVRQDSCVRTCNWMGYAKLRHHGYGHIIARQPASEEPSMLVAQQVASLLRLWLWSTRAIELERLDYYLSEFNFRYNARLHYAASNRAGVFNEVLRLALETDVPTMASHAPARAHG